MVTVTLFARDLLVYLNACQCKCLERNVTVYCVMYDTCLVANSDSTTARADRTDHRIVQKLNVTIYSVRYLVLILVKVTTPTGIFAHVNSLGMAYTGVIHGMRGVRSGL
jgi:hypothetical protein